MVAAPRTEHDWSRLRPVGVALATAVALTLLQMAGLYLLNATDFFGTFHAIYDLCSYPFRVVFGLTAFLANLVLPPEGAIQLLHRERVFMRVFSVLFSVYLAYFSVSKYRELRRGGDGPPDWKLPEGVLEVLGKTAALTFLQVLIIYLLHTTGVFPAFQTAYNTLFFPFDYAFGAFKSLANTVLGPREGIMVLNTDIFKRIFFVIFTINLLYAAMAEFLGEKHGDNR